jgi:hypothetical protein
MAQRFIQVVNYCAWEVTLNDRLMPSCHRGEQFQWHKDLQPGIAIEWPRGDYDGDAVGVSLAGRVERDWPVEKTMDKSISVLYIEIKNREQISMKTK